MCHQRSTSTDPLIRCTECGLVVHRFCYGVTDLITPWKCYPCRANLKSPMCSICMKVDTSFGVDYRQLLMLAFSMEVMVGVMFYVQN